MAAASSALQSVEVYTKGTKAWFEDKLEAWISATCISNTNDGNKVTIVFEGDNDQKVYKGQTRSLRVWVCVVYGQVKKADTRSCIKEYVFESTIQEIEKNGGSKLPPLRNPPKMEYTDDLTNLSHLNEPAGKG